MRFAYTTNKCLGIAEISARKCLIAWTGACKNTAGISVWAHVAAMNNGAMPPKGRREGEGRDPYHERRDERVRWAVLSHFQCNAHTLPNSCITAPVPMRNS